MPSYQTPQKSLYRVHFWKAVDRLCDVPTRDRKVIILEDSPGLEATHLLSLGYTPENILAVNRCAAKLAHVTKALKRQGLPRVRVEAGDFFNVVRAYGSYWADVINYDSCRTMCHKGWGRDLSILTDNIRGKGVIGLNIVGGHDHFQSDLDRIEKVRRAATYRSITKVFWGKYLNPFGDGQTPMLWFCMKHTCGHTKRRATLLSRLRNP